MRIGRTGTWVFGVVALALPWGQAQTGRDSVTGSRALTSSPAPAPASSIAQGEIVREIDDLHNGDRWLLIRDASHPGGPGLLRLVPAARIGAGQAGAGFQTQAAIHSGDRVIVEEHTRVADSRLEAVALSPATVGSPFNLRLKMGGRIVRAVALGPGRAVFEGEARR